MPEILHRSLPDDMRAPARLPGMQPVTGPWLVTDEVYGAQMAYRRQLLSDPAADVLYDPEGARVASNELLDLVLAEAPRLGHACHDDHVVCPDGARVPIYRGAPLATLGRVVQCDFCLLHSATGAGSEHVLRAAVLCFPASWSLSEKIERPLGAIHGPVAAYDADIARRVQRLFDGVRAGRPLWRFNRLQYEQADLHQPAAEARPRVPPTGPAPFLRSERQTLLRLPQSRWVVFAIHSYVLRDG